MNYSNRTAGDFPRRDFCDPKTSNIVRGYLLESKLRKILDEAISTSSYYQLHRQTGISLRELEEAVEDRVFLLDSDQLQYAIDLYGDKGIVSLVIYLHEPFLIDKPKDDINEPVGLLQQLYDDYQYLDEKGYPLEALIELCQDQQIPSIRSNGDFLINPLDLQTLVEQNQ